MVPHVCPWWLGYALLGPLRRLFQNPRRILAPFVREGMTVLEPGPGMGFFTLELARLVGPAGRVVAPDLQPEMLRVLRRRAARAGLQGRIEARLCPPDSMGLADLRGAADFALAFAVVHEVPDARTFFAELFDALKPGALLLLVEPAGHVGADFFRDELAAASAAGFAAEAGPAIRRSHSALLRKGGGEASRHAAQRQGSP